MHPHIFHMQFSTGAPPDYFDANGQNWGFPTYNWEEMAKDGYEWWRRRLTTMSQCVTVPPSLPHAAKLRPALRSLDAATLCSKLVIQVNGLRCFTVYMQVFPRISDRSHSGLFPHLGDSWGLHIGPAGPFQALPSHHTPGAGGTWHLGF